jgi:transcriptional regulator with XRE-family HTH domain
MDTKKRKGKSKRSLTPATESLITGRIKQIMDSQGLNTLELSKKSGVDNATLYKILGKRDDERVWTLDQLEKIAPALGVGLWELFSEPLYPPIVAEISNSEGPPIEKITKPEPIGYHPYPIAREDKKTLQQMYCLKVKDKTMLPIFRPGAILTAQRETWRDIANEDFVIYCPADGHTLIRQVWSENEHLILKSLTQGIPDMVLPKEHLRLCHRVLRIDFPAK